MYVLTYVHISLIALELPTNIYFSIETSRKKTMERNVLWEKLDKAHMLLKAMVKSESEKKTRKHHCVSDTSFSPVYVINPIQTPALHADESDLSGLGIMDNTLLETLHQQVQTMMTKELALVERTTKAEKALEQALKCLKDSKAEIVWLRQHSNITK